MIYALYPDCNISMCVIPGRIDRSTIFAIGASILNRSCEVNIGELCLKYGGGGHRNAGTCQTPNEETERVLGELIDEIMASSPVGSQTR